MTTENEDRLDFDVIREAEKKAREMISSLCAPNGQKWIMSIPARPKIDPDLVISDAIKYISPLIAENEKLRGQLAKIRIKFIDRVLNQ